MKRVDFAKCLLVCLMLAAPAPSQGTFPVISTVDEPEIAGRPVQLDAQGKLLPWPFPESVGDSYSSDFLAQWTILWDQFQRQRLPYFYCCFAIDPVSYEMIPDRNWANSTAYLRAMLEGFVEHLYPYTADERTLAFLENFVDYEMENGMTPDNYVWSGVPYPSANPGAARYSGWSSHGEDYVEPHVIGEDGYAYVRLYEMTGKTKYLLAAIHFADVLVRNYKPGDAEHSPWPVRCFARDGRVEGKGMGPYSANVLGPISLFDELIRLKRGQVSSYAKVRRAAWQWLEAYPLKNNVWVGYFEDVPPNMNNMNNVIPLELARYVLLNPGKDADWQQHARQLIEWVKTTPKWPKYRVHGALVTTEQGDGVNFCCNKPNQCCDSHTARLAAVEALYFARTGDESYKEEAMRSFNWVTYFQGLPGKAHAPFSEQWWFTDEFADAPRRLMDGFWAVPEWAPANESHLLGSTSVVTKISYDKGSVSYSTFDRESTDLLRLDFDVTKVTAGGRLLARRSDLSQEGFEFESTTRVLRIRHRRSGTVRIEGEGGGWTPLFVTFDDPHLPAGTTLKGEYPAGVITWTGDSWSIRAPSGGFGTFSLTMSNPAMSNPATSNRRGAFQLRGPRVFAGIDVYNAGPAEATLRVGCLEAGEITMSVGPGALKRLRTGWHSACSSVTFDISPEAELQFDNLAYLP
ncbi:MAG: hypothetical protein WBZ01_15335 [Terriglobales bacterium]|jgi:hypothetical protein